MEKNKNLFNRKASAPVEIGRFVKKKGVCHLCITYVKLDIFEFTCPSCNSTLDIDMASALVILKSALPMELRRDACR
jgi:Zn finger protein HypA/HybF involved in hydrogenase expression